MVVRRGEKDKPGAERRLTQRSRSSGCSAATTISKSSAATQIGIPETPKGAAPPVGERAAKPRDEADGDQNDRQLEAGRPRAATVVENVVAGFENAIREPVVAASMSCA
jgi:hypothetical protein